MLERFYRACVDVHHEGPKYNPKGFMPDDYMVGLCVLRLGGARLADLLHRALGLPGLTTLRKHSVIRPLRASPGMPTITEIEENIDAYTVGEELPVGPPRIVHRVMMLDEIAVEKRARWDDKTNMILGACREHAQNVPLEFCDIEDAKTFFAAVDRKEVHLASEATVVAYGALAREPHMYNPRPVCISGTCKHEKGEQHAAFLRTLNAAAESRKNHGNIIYRTISYASDGEAKRGLAFAIEFMKNTLTSTSSPKLHALLSPLEFMNLLVGPDDITPDKDFRHVIKTLRALLMRGMGIKVLGFHITPAIVKQHLRDVGNTKERVDSLLNPNDRQDVPLAYGLLKELWSLPDAPSTSTPTFVGARKALQIFGQLGYHLVMPYIYLNLSLREQLTHLSTAAHLLLILFTTDTAGTDFMANQTFVNIMIMIKNAFFCVAKAKVDIPDSEFFLILLGTDRLEKLFGLIRTAIGTDSNFDILQFCGRASNLTEVYIILGIKPHWDRGPRRIKLSAVINEAGDVSPKADHVSPASWIGDLHVSNVIPHTCWMAGRFKAEQIIVMGQKALKECALVPGFDILSPFGELLVNVPDTKAAFDIDPNLLRAASPPSDKLSEPIEPADDAPEDFEDLLAIHDTPATSHSPHVVVGGKKISKASILKDLMQNRSPRLSTDRTKRVAGIPAFANQSAASHITFDSPTGAPSLRIGNPIATMVECEGQYFLAVAQVNNIILGSSAIDSIVLDLLSDPGVKISYQILRLIAPNSDDGANGEYDWKWSFKFEHNSITNIPGRLIHPLNPTVSNRVPGEPTYLFSSEVLIAVAASIDSQLTGNYYDDIPKVQRSDTFPYRSAGKACFHIEHDLNNGNERGQFGRDPGASFLCTKCFPPVPIKTSNYQRILEHNGAHILFDKTILALDQPAAHNLKSLDNVPVVYQMGVDERGGVLKIWEKRQVYSIPRNMTKAKPKLVLPISDAHRALMVLRHPEEEPAIPAAGDESQADDESTPHPPVRRAQRTIIHDSDSDGSADSDADPTAANESDAPAPPAEYESDGYELEYFDEPPISHSLRPLTDDEVDREIEHFAAPGMDYAPSPPGLDFVESDAAASICAPEFPAVQDVSAALTTPQNVTVPVTERPADDIVASRLRSGKNKRKVKEMEFTCVCDDTVTAAQKADGSAIECSKAGCETIWYHLECVGQEASRKGWVCKSCGGGKQRR
ncbi:hypothetical protein B0H17DRAFT_1217291 [Mycena rosella]|uniref:Zinc finger PHD-type domain-containing protein n=1 Tax=Mycena rosella TaxID=1033263 RepID=A0AAD7C0K2_MYCRO|nr:hypothetical protein B0H17DRAFT_1217291 [Mycena rosella]